MPNHMHLMWQQNNLNGKETAKASLLKYTAYLFLKELIANGSSKYYEVNQSNKKHEIWQRDSLSIEIYSEEVAKQKLDYIHFNPVKGKWKLSKDDLDYHFSCERQMDTLKDHLDYNLSSSRFYETGIDDFGFLNNIFSVFDGG